jgi:sulfhydrogenase subunit alpha
MHQISELSQFSIEEITKVEGAAGLNVFIENGAVKKVEFAIKEFKRFYTHAMEGKPIAAIPQLLARICGTCSNAHLVASIEAVEKTLGIIPSEQTMILRTLTYHGLIIRDHALHLYLFCLPDMFGKDSLLGFDDDDPVQHQLLHDAFAVKAAGNHLAILVAGRSVHAPFPMPGGFGKIPEAKAIAEVIIELENIRPAVLRLIKVFTDDPSSLIRKSNYAALRNPKFSYLEGDLWDMKGFVVDEAGYRDHLEHVVLPYSQASAYTFKGETYRVGSIARLNINSSGLHPRTKHDAEDALKLFPSDNIFHNNLAQAIEILHSVDESIDLLKQKTFVPEPPQKLIPKAGVGVGLVEAPRGALYHKLEVNDKAIVERGEVVVPTGQNQIAIELDLIQFIGEHMDMEESQMKLECEKIIRAYDPCMSCGAHFLELKVSKNGKPLKKIISKPIKKTSPRKHTHHHHG